jgi:hypothetical protein
VQPQLDEGTHMTRTATRIAVIAAVAVAGVTSAAYAAATPLLLGSPAAAPQPTYQGYYDGHKGTYVITDVSDKAQAATLHVNYSAALASFKAVPA